MAEEEKVEKKKGMKLPLIIGAVVLAGVATFFGVKMMKGGEKEAQAAPAAHGKAAPAKGKGAEAAAEPVAIGLDPFIVNLADPAGNRFLKVSMRLVVNDKALEEEMKGELLKARVRDRIISVLTSKLFQDISTGSGKDALRRELLKEVNSVFPNEAVEEVLFVDFAVQ